MEVVLVPLFEVLRDIEHVQTSMMKNPMKVFVLDLKRERKEKNSKSGINPAQHLRKKPILITSLSSFIEKAIDTHTRMQAIKERGRKEKAPMPNLMCTSASIYPFNLFFFQLEKIQKRFIDTNQRVKREVLVTRKL